MAVRALKHSPVQRGHLPPLGVHPRAGKEKPPPRLKAKVTPITAAIKSVVPVRKEPFISEIDVELALEFKRLGLATKATNSGGSGKGGDSSWRPRWNHSFGGGVAVWNLLANAELMTPIGRRFIPDPNYNGDGLSPPQKDPRACYFDNVYDLAEARAKALEATRHSERSRGRVHKIVEAPPPLDVPVQQTSMSPAVQRNVEASTVDVTSDNQTKDWGKLDLSAFDNLDKSSFEWYAANEDMYSGNTEEEVDSDGERLRNQAWFAMDFCDRLYLKGGVHLSTNCFVESVGNEVNCHYRRSDGVYLVRRMTLNEFTYRIDDGGLPLFGYEWYGDTPVKFKDEMAFDVLGFDVVFDPRRYDPTWCITNCNEFSTWSNGDLEKLWHMHDHSSWRAQVEREAVFNGINHPVTQDEIFRWENELAVFEQERYFNELDAVAELRQRHRNLVMQHARLKPFGEVKIRHGNPWAKPLNDDNRYKLYWLRQYVWDEEFRLAHQLAVGYVPLVRADAVVPDFSIGHPTLAKRVKVKAVRAWNKMVGVLNKPVTSLFTKRKVAARVEPTLPKVIPEAEKARVDAVAEALAIRRVLLGSIQDDRYDLDWLEKLTGRRLDPNKPLPDPVELAIQAVKNDVPTEVYSEAGIYLGKKVQLPRTEGGLILPTHMPTTGKGSSPNAA